MKVIVNNYTRIFLVLFVVCLLCNILVGYVGRSEASSTNQQKAVPTSEPTQTTVLSVEPSVISEPVGTTFSINIGLTDIEDLFGLAIEFQWNPAILDYVNHLVHIPAEDYQDGVLWGGILWLVDNADATAGFYELGVSSFGFPSPPSFNGSGIVFDMTFYVLAEGVSGLDFILDDLSRPWGGSIEHQTINGTFDNRPSVEYMELVVAVNGSGMTDPRPGTYLYDEDTVVPVDAIPDFGWMLDHWKLDGVPVGDSDPYDVTMDANHTLIAFFTIQDIDPPQISVSWTPTAPYPLLPSLVPRHNEPVVVWANVTDVGGIDFVNLHYRSDGGEWWNTSMVFNVTEGLWMTTIPGHPGNTTIELKITASDLIGNIGETPIVSYMVQHLLVGDLDGNGLVDIFDIVLAADNYGEEYP